MRFLKTIFLFLFLFMCAGYVQAQAVRPVPYYSMNNWDTSPYKSYRFTRPEASWQWINFRLLFPNGYDSTAQDGKEYPIILMLHGAGESARMKWDNPTKTNTPYPTDDPRRDNNDHQLMFGGREHLRAVESGRFPGFVLFPQNFYGTWVNGKGDASSTFHQDLEKTISLVEHLVKNLKIDPSRIYVHGLSAGGLGTWLAAYKRPDLFAAALPMSAPGDPAMAGQLAEVPLWVFQGELDTNPRPWATKQTVEAVRDAGGEVRYTEYEGAGHNTWNRAYGERDFFEWMLAHKKSNVEGTNKAPVVNAGENKNISLPENSASFTAVASDPDGTIVSYSWIKKEGPEATMSGAATATLSLTGLVQGTYTFQVSVTDNKNAIATDEVILVVNPAANKPPVVDAGADKEVTLPVNTVTFTATASDPDGTIATYLWEEVNGLQVNMSGTDTKTLSISKPEQGTYTFKVTVTDNNGAKISDQVVLTVKPAPNVKPVVNAGNDKEITLPANSVSFTAEASDSDGNLASYKWEKVSGPEATLSGVTTPVLSLSDLKEGSYVFKITVTDNEGATAADEVGLKVNPAPNKPPVVNAGTDKTITLPENTAGFKATASDPEGGALTWLWEKVSGPAATLSGASTAELSLSGLAEGSYVFRLTVKDNAGATAADEVGLKVNPAPNKPPVVNAGTDKTITLPENTATFTASASDPDGSIASYLWEKTEGPQLSMNNAATKTVSLSGLTAGTYKLKVTVTDNSGATAADEVVLVVNPAPNKAPVVDAGADKTITLPENTATFTASASDPDGSIASYLWKKVSGPAATLSGETTKTLSLTGLTEGSYSFSITVTDNQGAATSDQVVLHVNPAANKPPVVDAGADKEVTLPVNTASFTATASDPDGTISTYLWEKVKGPEVSMGNTGTKTLSLSELKEGSYTFRVWVTDNAGSKASDEVNLEVKPAPNQPPVVDAGADKTITLPVNTAGFTATASDPEGKPLSYMWEKVSGPAATAEGLSTASLSLTGLQEGTYTYKITVTDSEGATASDEVVLKVNSAPNQPPVVNAGTDKAITLPENTVSFTATASDPEGKALSYLWGKISGPSATLAGVSTPTLSVSGLQEGTYTFRVSVTDAAGAIATDEVVLVVNPAPNQAPTVSAGKDKITELPENTASFTATASDPDGSIASYLWEKVSGPAAVLSGVTTPVLSLTALREGSYVFRITVTDSRGAVAKDEVALEVKRAPNVAPTVNAGEDRTITLPENTATLIAAATDPDGAISEYLWTKVSGPEVSLRGETTETLYLSGLTEGNYSFRIKVTDSRGGTATDDVNVIVKVPANKNPVVEAGEKVNLTLPKNTVTLSATASDPDGSIASYLWEKVNGPAATLTDKDKATLKVSGLEEGSYTFRVTVTDNKGATASDEVIVSVFAEAVGNQSPLANAGSDTTVVLPLEYLGLKGTGTDNDGTIVSYLWEKVSGPKVRIGYADSSYMELAELVTGEYVFRLTVTDDAGATAWDEMTLTVTDTPVVNGLEPGDIGFISLVAYPNPFESLVNIKIEMSRQETLLVRVFDPLSKTIFRGSFESVAGREVIYTFEPVAAGNQQGVYFVEVRSHDGKFSKMIRVLKK